MYKKSFEKDLEKLPLEVIKKVLKFISTLEKENSFVNISQMKKMKGFPNSYRKRIGDYRIGLSVSSDSIKLERVGHRKEIYKKFP